MLTGMTERDWAFTLEVFDTVQRNQGEPGHDDRKFLKAIHYFTVHSITWRALPNEFGNWNSVWKRFWRLSRSGVFEAFFQILAECSETAHLIQFFDSTLRALTSRPLVQEGAEASGPRPLAWRLLDQNSPQDRSRRPSSRFPPDRWRSQRQDAVRDIARQRPGHPPAHRGDRQRI